MNSRITALEWINGFDVAMLMVASDDGSVKVYQPSGFQGNREPSLVSAWQAHNELSVPSNKSATTGEFMHHFSNIFL